MGLLEQLSKLSVFRVLAGHYHPKIHIVPSPGCLWNAPAKVRCLLWVRVSESQSWVIHESDLQHWQRAGLAGTWWEKEIITRLKGFFFLFYCFSPGMCIAGLFCGDFCFIVEVKQLHFKRIVLFISVRQDKSICLTHLRYYNSLVRLHDS